MEECAFDERGSCATHWTHAAALCTHAVAELEEEKARAVIAAQENLGVVMKAAEYGREWRTASQVAIDDGHARNCERVTHPNSAHPCDCGLPDALAKRGEERE